MKKQYSKVIKIVIQILFFLWIPESFAASLYAVKKLIHAVSVMDFTYAREPVLLLLETVVTTAVFGRYYCGYICSFGAAQDLSYDLGNLIRKQTKYRKKRMLSVKTDKILSKLKYPVLVIVAVSAVWKKNLLDVISPWKGFASLLSMLRGNFSKENLISAGVWICIIVLVTWQYFSERFADICVRWEQFIHCFPFSLWTEESEAAKTAEIVQSVRISANSRKVTAGVLR